MLTMGTALAVVVALGVLIAQRRRPASSPIRVAAGAVVTLALVGVIGLGGQSASAAIVPTVNLATAANYAVLAGSEVTNTGPSVLNGSVGVWAGSSVTGFPPGVVVPPATIDITNGVAQQAQADQTAAYLDALGRPLNATTTADLTGLTLVGGVYAGPSKGALQLTGPLVLDGENNLDSVFIFQTDSSLTTGSGSSVTLINGAQACNVFWQVGSSATLGTGSVFVGNIMALASVSLNDSVTVEGRALAQTGAVTLINDTFITPSCAQSTGTTTSTTSAATSTTVPGSATTAPASLPGGATTLPGGATTTLPVGSPLPGLTPAPGQPTPVGPLPVGLPATGADRNSGLLAAMAAATLGLGLLAWQVARRPPSTRGRSTD